jgi:hypothetical protein
MIVAEATRPKCSGFTLTGNADQGAFRLSPTTSNFNNKHTRWILTAIQIEPTSNPLWMFRKKATFCDFFAYPLSKIITSHLPFIINAVWLGRSFLNACVL